MPQSKTIGETESPLSRLRDFVAADMACVDSIIKELIQSNTKLIPDIALHTVSAGGKRLRPMLTLACARICGYGGKAHIDLAASVEFIHTATLLHDDVVDNSCLRRGVDTANNLWGNKESILVGDYLLAKSFQLMGSAGSLEIYRALANAAAVISEGEVMQLAGIGNIAASEESYFHIINAKTAELFAAACEVGAIVAGADKDKSARLRDYGMKLGLAFQIIDDALDYAATGNRFGKNTGDDFFDKKATLPVILAYRAASPDEKTLLERVFDKGYQASGKDFTDVIKIVNNTGGIEQSIAKAGQMAESAAGNLGIFEGELAGILRDITDFVVQREF